MDKGIALLFVLAVLAACSRTSDDHQIQDVGRNVLNLTAGSGPVTLDPHRATGVPAWKVLSALVEGLVSMDYKTMEIMPGVAETWQESEDGLRLLFHLRTEAKWSNGEPLTAADFVYSWQRMLSPGLGNPYATDLFAVKNARAFFTRETTDFSTVGVKALSDRILEITLEYYDPLFLRRLAAVTAAPVHRGTVEKFGAIDDPGNAWTHAGHFVGNGPFTLTKWELDSFIEVEKSASYWDAEQIKLDALRFWPVESEAVQERLFRAGQLHFAYEGTLSPEKIAGYKNRTPQVLFTQPIYGTYSYYFNTTRTPFNQAAVRKAFALAIDKSLIVERVTRAGELEAYAITPIDDRYSAPRMASYDPVKAREFLAAAGFPGGQGFPPVTLIYNTTDMHRKIAVAIQQMLKKELNVNVVLENQEWQVFLSNRKNLDFQVARAGAVSNLADPLDFLDSFKSGHGMNHTGWSNADYDALVNEAVRSNNSDQRMALLAQAESILLDELPVLPLFYYVKNYLVAPEVKGVQFNVVDMPDYRGVYLDVQ